MLVKSCIKCGAIIVYPKSYCDDCLPLVKEQREENSRRSNQRYNKTRDPRYSAFYKSDPWRSQSRAYIREKKYKCEDCGKMASEVHHKIPIQTPEGWERRLDWTNLKAQCIKCHNKAHGRFQKRKTRSEI